MYYEFLFILFVFVLTYFYIPINHVCTDMDSLEIFAGIVPD